MKAAVLQRLNQPLLIKNISYSSLEYGQVLVKLAYSGVCHSQLMEARGNRGEDRYLPHLLGHEGTGIVIEVGEGVTKVAAGEKVILGWIKGEGIEAVAPKYFDDAQRKVNAGGVTTFNEYAVVSENRLVPLPKGVPMDIGVLFGCALPTGAGIVLNELKPKKNASIAIFGLGGIGLSALMAANISAPRQLIAIDIEEDKLTLATSFGATHTINASNENVLERLREISDGGVDYSVEASGNARIIEMAFEGLKNGGLSIFASHPKHGERISLDPFALICGKQIRGSWGGASQPDRDIKKLATLYTEGKLPLEKLLSEPYQLEDINQALDDLESRKIIRAIIEINKDLT